MENLNATATINTTSQPSTNTTTHPYVDAYLFTDTVKIVLYTCYSTIFFLGMSGNLIVIYFIGIKHRIRRSFDVHILSLAVSDLLAAIFTPVVGIHDTVLNYGEWRILGTYGCKLFVSMNHLTSIVSCFMLVTISITRLQVIRSDLKIQRTVKRASIEVICIWLLAISVVLPYTYHLQVSYNECYDKWKKLQRFSYFAVIITCTSFIPIFIMIFVYTLSIFKLYRIKVPGDNQHYLAKRVKQNRKIVKMFGTIVAVFFCVTTPYMVCYFIVAVYGTFDPQKYIENGTAFFYANIILYAVASFNCCVNPFIYANMHQNMKATFSTRSILYSISDKLRINKFLAKNEIVVTNNIDSSEQKSEQK